MEIIVLCLIIVIQQVMHYLERKDLYERMSNKEFKNNIKNKPVQRTANCLIRKNNDLMKGGENA